MSGMPTMATTNDDVRDPTSAAYKRARRLHFKSTKHRETTAIEQNWTPFRASEKRYKARFPPPDLSGVLDLATLDTSRTDECARGGWAGRSDAVQWREIPLNNLPPSRAGCKAYTIPAVPGLVLLPAFISPSEQRELIRISLSEQARYPNDTNLDVHYDLPKEGLWNAYVRSKDSCSEEMLIQPVLHDPDASLDPPGPRKLVNNIPATADTYAISSEPKLPPAPAATAQPASPAVLLTKLRWANIGYFYHWGSKQYDFSKGKGTVHPVFRKLCKTAVRTVDWLHVFGTALKGEEWGEDDWRTWNNTYEPDAGIVNFYQAKDTLMAHVDRSEACATSPLVSVSLGNGAVFLIGGLTRDVEPIPILLRSGDVVIMSGPACRRAYHGVPRILENTLPPHLESLDDCDSTWTYFEEHLRTSRININVRQVFPRGFEPKSRHAMMQL